MLVIPGATSRNWATPSTQALFERGINREGEDLYFMYTLIEVVADDLETLEQRAAAVETLCVASDMLAKRCEFKTNRRFYHSSPAWGLIRILSGKAEETL